MAREQLLGHRAVENHQGYAAMLLKKGTEVIDDLRSPFYAGIQAAVTPAGPEHIPKCNPGVQETLDTLVITQFPGIVGYEHLVHDGPECVSGMGIILPRFQRRDAWHGAKDEDSCIGPGQQWETVNSGQTLAHNMIYQVKGA